jgi:hypothetical protein
MPASSAYEKRQDGNFTVFKVTPAGVPKFGTIIGIGVVSVLLGFGFMGESGGGGFFFFAMGAFAIWYGGTRAIRPKPHRKESTFRVSPESIEVDGKTYRVADIHRVILRNGITDKELDVQVTMTNVPTAAAAGMAHRARIGLVTNALTFEAVGKATFLAGGMDETTAYGLQHDVCAVIGFK